MVDIEGGLGVKGAIRGANSAIAGQDVGMAKDKKEKKGKKGADKSKPGLKERGADAVGGAQDQAEKSLGGLQKSLGEDAAAVEDRTSALAEQAKADTASIAAVDPSQRLEEELAKAKAQMGARSSEKLGELKDAAPKDPREALAMAKAEAARQEAKAEAKADKEAKKAEAKEAKAKPKEAEPKEAEPKKKKSFFGGKKKAEPKAAAEGEAAAEPEAAAEGEAAAEPEAAEAEAEPEAEP